MLRRKSKPSRFASRGSRFPKCDRLVDLRSRLLTDSPL